MNCEHCGDAKAKIWHLVCASCWDRLPANIRDELVASHAERVRSDRHIAAINATLHFLEMGRVQKEMESEP